MPLNARNTRTFQRTLYGGIGYLKRVTLLKRDDDQRQGTVRAVTLFRCRRESIHRTGEPIQGDMTSDASTTWHIPKVELERAGVAYLSAADRIVESTNDLGRVMENPRHWQPESTTLIEHELFENEVDVACLRVDSLRN